MSSTKRRKARELLVQALYASEVGQTSLPDALADAVERRGPGEDVTDYVDRVGSELEAHCGDLDVRIDAAIDPAWSPDRVGVIERCILRLALAEFLYVPETPPRAALTEALELAKTYTTDDAAKFVNGVLDRLLKDIPA